MKRALPLLITALSAALPALAQESADAWYQAIRNGDQAGLRNLIARGSGTEVKDKAGSTPLMFAAGFGTLDSVKALLDAGADVNAQNQFGATALMWCAIDEEKVKLLLAKGADVNAVAKNTGQTALGIAADTQGNIRVVQMLLDHGADIAKAEPPGPGGPLVSAADANDTAIVRLLLEHGANVKGPAGGFAFLEAAAHGNLELMKMLVAKGVPVDQPSPPAVGGKVKHGDIALGLLRPLQLAVSFGGYDAVRYLVEQKADVNSQDIRGMTPLMLAIAVDHGDPRIVSLLLEHGADPAIRSKAGESAIDWARKFNRPEVLAALKLEPHPLIVQVNAEPRPLRDAVQKSAQMLQGMSGKFFVESGCSSCHAQHMTSLALSAAQKAGVIAAGSADMERTQQNGLGPGTAQGFLLRRDPPGGANMVAFAFFQMAADSASPSFGTDAMLHNLAAQQWVNGSWHNDATARPPMDDGDFTATAMAIQAIRRYAPPARRAEFDARLERAMTWLRRTSADTQEDRNMQLLGLTWGGADRATLARLSSGLIALQGKDGGWSQTQWLPRDAYATGQTLVALKEAGVPPENPAFRRGVEFLLKTQASDGTWHVVSRAPKFQPYFQSGFPYDHDQWISMAGTGWATAALSYAAQEQKTVASK